MLRLGYEGSLAVEAANRLSVGRGGGQEPTKYVFVVRLFSEAVRLAHNVATSAVLRDGGKCVCEKIQEAIDRIRDGTAAQSSASAVPCSGSADPTGA